MVIASAADRGCLFGHQTRSSSSCVPVPKGPYDQPRARRCLTASGKNLKQNWSESFPAFCLPKKPHLPSARLSQLGHAATLQGQPTLGPTLFSPSRPQLIKPHCWFSTPPFSLPTTSYLCRDMHEPATGPSSALNGYAPQSRSRSNSTVERGNEYSSKPRGDDYVYVERSTKGFSSEAVAHSTAAKLKLESYYKVAVDAAIERNARCVSTL